MPDNGGAPFTCSNVSAVIQYLPPVLTTRVAQTVCGWAGYFWSAEEERSRKGHKLKAIYGSTDNVFRINHDGPFKFTSAR